MTDVSVILPTIRVHLLDKWYESLTAACPRHSFEVICCGPFEPSAELLAMPNFKWVKSFASPTVCTQMCLLEAQGKYIYHTVDDVTFYDGTISDELDRMNDSTIISMRYREGEGYNGHLLPDNYWHASNAYPGWQGVDPSWGICVHFLIPTDIVIFYGGFDCQFDYLNHATHDLLFRIQQDVEEIDHKLSLAEVTSADWMPGTTGDHAAIHYAQTTHDEPLFAGLWSQKNDRGVIDLLDYQNYPTDWERRFTGQEKSYQEIEH